MRIILLCGGKGSRLWPYSSNLQPKQFIKINNEASLFQKTLLRFFPFYSAKDFLLITSSEYKQLCIEQACEIHEDFPAQIIEEPFSKNTAFALYTALKEWKKFRPFEKEEAILVLPCDHYIDDDEKLRRAIKDSLETVKPGYHVIFGIPPAYPETGYGYILPESTTKKFSAVEKFVEKPSEELAKIFVLSGKYLWNSGMFLFHAEKIFEDIDKYYLQGKTDIQKLPNLSIDKAILEHTDSLMVTALDVKWTDLGDWQRLIEHLPKDENGNIIINNIKQKETYNCTLIGDKKKIISIGLKDTLIIETQNEVFVISKEKLKELNRYQKEFVCL